MWIRYRFDLTWLDFLAAAKLGVATSQPAPALQDAQRAWGSDEPILISLSVRSAFDTLLRALALPPGSEVLLSALTVPDMARIVAAHQLVPVPVDLDEHFRVTPTTVQAAISPQSRVLVVAQLFGDQAPLGEIASLARAHGLLLVEDRAQSLIRPGERGDPHSDVVLHSFGPIKIATALGGAVATIRNPEIYQRMAELSSHDPRQNRWRYLRRVAKFAALQFVARGGAPLIAWFTRISRRDPDAWLNSLGRGFHAHDLLQQLRQRPCTPLLRLLARRWQGFSEERLERRRQLGRQLDALLATHHASEHTYWVYPVEVADPIALRQEMLAAGFDATARSRMALVPATPDGRRAPQIEQRWARMVFLPWYPELTHSAVEHMARIVLRHQDKSAGRQSL